MTVVVLGLILLVAAGVLTAAVVTSNTGVVDTDLWGTTIANLSLGAVFVAGMITTLVGVGGLALILVGAQRSRRLRQERRVLRRENRLLSRQIETSDTGETPRVEPDEDPGDAPRRSPFFLRRSTASTARPAGTSDRTAEPVDTGS